MLIWIILALVVALIAYIRLAPANGAALNSAVKGEADKDGMGHCLRVIPATPGALAQIDAAMRALPRTTVVAGSVQEGRITYQTRSQWIGFPDYTTVEETGAQIKLFARLRFGRSDFGVNKARLTHVLNSIAQG